MLVDNHDTFEIHHTLIPDCSCIPYSHTCSDENVGGISKKIWIWSLPRETVLTGRKHSESEKVHPGARHAEKVPFPVGIFNVPPVH